MSGADLIALAPIWLVSLAAVVVMLVIAVRRHHGITAGLSIAGLLVGLVGLWPAARAAPRQVTTLLVVDAIGVVFSAIVLLAAIAVVLLAYGYFQRQLAQREELYVLVLLATVGALVLVHSAHFASLFLGLETLSVSLFALIAYMRRSRAGIEAGLKYLILAGMSSAVMLFGMAVVYADVGTMQLGELARAFRGAGRASSMTFAGASLMVVGFGFKLALVPFHHWTADVYQGAPAPVTALVASVSKAGVVAVLARFLEGLGGVRGTSLYLALAVIAGASMIIGNLLALRQQNLKRLFAYSSIAHLGYILVAFLPGGRAGTEAVVFYVAAYVATILGAFGVIAALTSEHREPDTLDDIRGLYWQRPLVAAVLTTCLLSLAGIPLTAGFIAKFYVLATGIDAGMWVLMVILILTSTVGLYYYLRVVVAMLAAPAVGQPARGRIAVPIGAGIVLAVIGLSVVWLGVFPSTLAQMIRAAVTGV